MGGLVSVFCFRKVATAILDKVFNIVPNEASSSAENTLFSLPRSHANELSLAAALLPVAGSNLLAQVSNLVLQKKREHSAAVSCHTKGQALWFAGDFKGAHSFLQP